MTIAAMLMIGAAPPALARLDGHCWRGEIGPGVIDTHCFATRGGVTTDVHVVTKNDTEVYRGRTDYRTEGDTLRYTYANASGIVASGIIRRVRGGIDFITDGRTSARWRWAGPTAYADEKPAGRVIFRMAR